MPTRIPRSPAKPGIERSKRAIAARSASRRYGGKSSSIRPGAAPSVKLDPGSCSDARPAWKSSARCAGAV
jgi:hypothetical protein